HDLGRNPAYHDLDPLAQGRLRRSAALTSPAHRDAQSSVLVVDQGNVPAVSGNAAIDFAVEKLLDGGAHLDIRTSPCCRALGKVENRRHTGKQLRTNLGADIGLQCEPLHVG